MDDIMKKHINAAVERRAQEIEAFLLAQMRIADLNPADVVLQETRGKDGLLELSLRIKP